MSATLLSSCIVFIASGAATLFFLDHSGGWVSKFTEGPLPFFVFVALLSNALYFYYYSAMAELHTPTRQALKNASRAEWIVRLVNHTLILLLWITFDSNSPWLFGACLFLLYTTFLVWDYTTYKALRAQQIEPVWLITIDAVGFIVALALGVYLFIWMGPYSRSLHAPATMAAVFGWICGIYLAIAVVGLLLGFFKYQFNPFSKAYYARSALH